MSEYYDVIVIGTGIGGLTCGAFLAQRGYKVLLLEKNSFIGGCCSSFRRNGFLFDSCVHWFAGGGPNTFINKIFKKIGINVDFVRYAPLDRFHFNDQVVTVPNGVETYRDLLIHKYPEETAAIHRFFSEMKHVYQSFSSFIVRPEQKEDFTFSSGGKMDNRTYQQCLDFYFKSNSLKAILSTQCAFISLTPAEASAVAMMGMMYGYYKEGVYYPVGGAQSLSDKLGSFITSQNGTIMKKAEVIGMDVDNNKIRKVRLKSGDEYRAKLVISNIDAKHLVNNLLNNKGLSTEEWTAYRRKVNSMQESISMFVLYLGLDIPGEALKEKMGWHIDGSLAELDEIHDTSSFFREVDGCLINVPSVLDPSICQKNKSVMILYTKIPSSFYDEGKDWRKVKLFYEKKYLNFIDKHIWKDIEKHIEVKESATPKTINRFTSNSKGAAYGWALTVAQQWNRRLPIRTPIDNLFITGHWAVPGGGVIPSICSGWLAKQEAVDFLETRI